MTNNPVCWGQRGYWDTGLATLNWESSGHTGTSWFPYLEAKLKELALKAERTQPRANQRFVGGVYTHPPGLSYGTRRASHGHFT